MKLVKAPPPGYRWCRMGDHFRRYDIWLSIQGEWKIWGWRAGARADQHHALQKYYAVRI